MNKAKTPWRLHSMRVLSGVPRSQTCITAEGEGTHDWAAVLRDAESESAAIVRMGLRQWAEIVKSCMVNG